MSELVDTPLPLNSNRPSVSQKWLRNLSDLAPGVVLRHRGVHPAVEAMVEPVIASCGAFRGIYDTSRTGSVHAAREQAELEEAVAPLRRALQAWMGPLKSAVPTMNVGAFSNAARTPLGTITDGRRMIEMVRRHQEDTGVPLPFADQLIADLGAKLEAAEKEHQDVVELASSTAELRARTRAAAAELHRNLVGLRRVLRAVIGRSHPDYRALLQRSGNATEDPADDQEDAHIDDAGDTPEPTADSVADPAIPTTSSEDAAE